MHTGEYAALTVAIVWTATAILFEIATKRIGVLPVNMIRLIIAFFMLGVISTFATGHFLPVEATSRQWFLLSVSGLIGFVFGDWCLFKAFELTGSRLSMLVMASNPAMAAVMGYFFLTEKLGIISVTAMLVTFVGIVIAVMARNASGGKHKVSFIGILYGLGGALGQAGGLIFSKMGMGDYNAFAATEIRVIAATIGFGIIIIYKKQVSFVIQSFTDKRVIYHLLVASFLGPTIGVGLSLYALQHANTGVASSIMSIVPVLIIIPSVLFLKQKVSIGEVAGAVVSTVGVILFFV